MQGDLQPAYEFGAFCLDVAEQRLLCAGRPLPLTPKVFDVLRVLVQNHGHLVEKERLLAEVWPDSFVEEGALSRSISILRKTLGESDSGQKFIETVPKRGYRFVAVVVERAANGDGGFDRAAPESDVAVIPLVSVEQISPKRAWERVGVLVGAGVAGLLVAGAILSTTLHPVTRPTPDAPLTAPLHRQVTFTGKERAPTISPDGKRIAFVSVDRPEKKLVVQQLAGGPPLTIFTAPEIGYLRWSPDGADLIVWARGAGKNGVYVIPQLGGIPRPIAGGQFIACWSPDGSTIAVATYMGKIWLFDRSGRRQRTLSLRDVNWSIWDIDWSVKGVLTFVSSDPKGHYTVWTVKPDGNEQRRIVDTDAEIPSVRWAPSGDAVYYFRRLNQTFSLFKIGVPPHTNPAIPKALVAGIEIDRLFALSADAKRLVYARAPYYSNLWVVDANGGRDKRPQMQELTTGTSLIERPSVSPDGTTLVFNVGHGPATNLYTMPITGSVPRQLTFRDSLNVEAVWSANGRLIAFASTEGGRSRIWAVNASGGEPVALSSTDMGSDTFDLTWSPGARILYQQSGNRNYYELEPATRAERFLLDDDSRGWIFSPVYSPDGRKVAVQGNLPPRHGIYVIDASEHREKLVYATPEDVTPLGWSADAHFIYVLDSKTLNFRGPTAPGGETKTEARILRVSVEGGPATTVAVLPFEEIGGVTMTPDGRKFICAVYSSRSDIWVVDDFDPSP
jgi:Tol biopolymer transport system component/DNA-binding winged helix-turn-helix (wHTH) protein